MRRLNQDAIVAIILLLVSGVLFWSTFSIRSPDYGVLTPSAWPRAIIIALAFLSSIYLIQSVKDGPSEHDEAENPDKEKGLKAWFVYWKNPIICFVLFFLYLVTLPYLGSLIGGVAFVFSLMSVLGGVAPRDMATHAVLSMATVGGMWSIFNFGLDVILPTGVIFSVL